MLDIVDYAHLGIAVGTDADRHVLTVGQRGTQTADFIRNLGDSHIAVVQLDARLVAHDTSLLVDGLANKQIDQTGLALLFDFGALRYLIAHAGCHLTHVGDNHEEEEHRENQVGQGCQVQAWHVAIM